MKVNYLAGAIIASMIMGTATVNAAENGKTAYMVGSSMFTGAALPPIPGVFGELIGNYSNWDRMNDGDGDDSFKNNPAPYNQFKIESYALTLRAIWMTDKTVLGGRYAAAIVVPLVYLDATLPTDNYDYMTNTLTMKNGDDTSVGDVTVTPGIIAWDLGNNFSVAGGLDISVPVGHYSKSDVISVGRNYWSFQPVLSLTYKNPEGFEAHAVSRLMFNTENNATDYTTGNEFNSDISVGYNLNESFRFGIQGYIWKQLTDDKQDGVKQDFKSEAYGAGPILTYKKGPAEFNLAWVHDWEAKNTTLGDEYFFKMNFKI